MMVAEKGSQPSRSPHGLWTGVLLVIAVLLLGVLFGRFVQPSHLGGQSTQRSGVGQVLPLVELQGLGGLPAVELSGLEGSVVLINFWGTWCPPCVAELPHIASFGVRFGDRPDFRLLAVTCGPNQGAENFDRLAQTTQRFLDSQQITVPVYTDIGGATRRAVGMALDGELGLQGYPTTILLDKNSIIRAVWIGYSPGTEEEMQTEIERLLAS